LEDRLVLLFHAAGKLSGSVQLLPLPLSECSSQILNNHLNNRRQRGIGSCWSRRNFLSLSVVSGSREKRIRE
jgi:hypothetical protein